MQKLIGIYEKSKNFWFVIPTNKKKFKEDFFIQNKNSLSAKDKDLVEIEILEWKKWKNKEAKIIKIFEKTEEKKETIIWIYSQNREKNFWFIDVEWLEKWFFVYEKNKLSAMDWDKVEAIVKVFNWKSEAEVIRVLERKQNFIVWEYKIAKWKNFWFVIPKSKKYDFDVFVPFSNSFSAWDWDIVSVEIIKYSWKNPEWIIREIIWKKWKIDKREEDILTLALEAWARITFDEKILKDLEKIDSKISKEEFEKRKNLKNIFTFTIDWADAKDLDDAISIEKKENWDFILYVSIADVSHYVSENSLLDKEAFARATSIYMADRVIPMLPEKLSNDLCSLNPNTDKLALTCEMHIWAKTGNTIKTEVYNSIINSDFRLTYKEVDEIISWKIKLWDKLKFSWIVTEKLLEKIFLSNDLKEKILNFREEVWVLNFDFPETYITFDEKWDPNWVAEYPKYDSNKMIESFMVSANEAVSKLFSKYPFLYRIHEEPKDLDIKTLENKLDLFWVKFKFKDVTTEEFSKLLKKYEDLEPSKKIFLERMTLRTLTQAIYSETNLGHFWLWLKFYSHFTSPIRRYPDLQIHRIIKEIISSNFDLKRKNHYKEILPFVAKKSSEKERQAEKLEYRVRDYFIVKYYKNKVGQDFDAIISWVIPKWFFVQLQDTAEWFVELKNSIFDEQTQSHKFSWKKYSLWASVKVKLIEADEKLLRLNFEIL